MQKRRRTFEEAIDEYLVFQLRLSEFIHLFQIAIDEKRAPRTKVSLPYDDVFGTLQSAAGGWFVSLLDKNSSALNIIDVWLVLFPRREAEIRELWDNIAPHVKLLREYRDNVVFHSNKSLKRQFEVRKKFADNRPGITKTFQQFVKLAARLIGEQSEIPNFNEAVKQRLRFALPGADVDELSKLFVMN